MLTRRAVAGFFAAVPLAAPALAQGAWAPSRPISLVVAFPAGGGTDVAARTIARFMERDLGGPVVVLNRAGAGGAIGFTELARAQPDGHTIGFINTPPILTIPIERRVEFSLQSFAPIANVVDDPGGLWVLPDSPHRSVADLVAAARARPEAISYGTTGIGSDDHLAMLALSRVANVRFLHAPFAGAAPVRQNLLSRTIDVAVMNISEGLADMRQGLMRPLAQMGERRWEKAPEVPTLRELGFDVVEGSMRGMAAPAGVPPAALERLALSIRRTVENPEFQAAAEQQGLPLRFLGPVEFARELGTLSAGYRALWAAHPWRES